jgi:hypothetical protein
MVSVDENFIRLDEISLLLVKIRRWDRC